jgi:glycosyltransferase involved in cell wall biosynthesis
MLFRRPFLAARARRCDLVHVDGDAAAILSASITTGRPYIVTTAGLHLLRRSTGRRGRIVARLLRRRVLGSAATLCTSRAELDELRTLCGPEAPLRLVPNGVPLPPRTTPEGRDTARRELALGGDEVVGLMLTRLEPRKQPLLAARAATRVRASGIPFLLLVAGDGPQRAELEALDGPALRLLGFRDDAQRLIAAADLFVLVSEREGLSLALLEAMGGGLPAVVSDGPGNPEAVGEDAGIVVPTGNEDALVRALAELATDPGRRSAGGAAARRRVEERFTVGQMLHHVDAAYRQALQRAR